MSATKLFNPLKTSIVQKLKKEGFSKKGAVLYKMSHNNCLQIGFQKSRSSTATEILFTINLSIHSEVLREGQGSSLNIGTSLVFLPMFRFDPRNSDPQNFL